MESEAIMKSLKIDYPVNMDTSNEGSALSVVYRAMNVLRLKWVAQRESLSKKDFLLWLPKYDAMQEAVMNGLHDMRELSMTAKDNDNKWGITVDNIEDFFKEIK